MSAREYFIIPWALCRSNKQIKSRWVQANLASMPLKQN